MSTTAPEHLRDEDVVTGPGYVPVPDANAEAFPMKRSASIAALATALAKAQGQFPAIEKDKHATIVMKAGGKYSYTYADLASVFEAVRPALSQHGLSVTQSSRLENRGVIVTTILLHASGEWLCSDPMPMPIGDAADPRSVASAMTYARRYSVLGLLGVSKQHVPDSVGRYTVPIAFEEAR